MAFAGGKSLHHKRGALVIAHLVFAEQPHQGSPFLIADGLNSNLHAVRDGEGKPSILPLTEGQLSDYRGAATLLPDPPDADALIADKGHDGDWLRKALAGLAIIPCLPRATRKPPIPCDADLHTQRNRLERMFGRLKDRRRIATRYDRCAHARMSAICVAATVIFWL